MIKVARDKSELSGKNSLWGTKKDESFFRDIIENAKDIIYRCKVFPELKCEYVSPSVKEKLGYNPEEYYADPKFIYKIIHPDYIEIARDIHAGNFDFSKPAEICYIHRNGSLVWCEDNMTPFYDSYGELIAIEGILHDISERKEMEKRLSYLSFHDSLTNLYNRAYFEEELKRLDTERQIPSSIIMGDINGLKIINDAFGHKEGDEILKSCADVLRKCCRAEDIIARWGGDEFSIILPETTKEVAMEVVNRVRENSTRTTRAKLPLSISLGVSTRDNIDRKFPLVIKEAEDNMYRQKLIEAKSIIGSIISSIEKTLFEKSIKSEKHTKKAREMAIRLGKSIGLSASDMEELSMLATMHDIGKVAILDIILSKKENLSKKEWDTIKRHPEIGYRIALSSEHLSSIAKYILTVHEWWNGKGYPQGLKGEDIPVLSRIITITDAYEVMITGRPYKKAINKEEAMAELKRFSGTQFDPYLVDKFIDILNSGSN